MTSPGIFRLYEQSGQAPSRRWRFGQTPIQVRLSASAAEMKHWLAEIVFTDAPLGSVGENAMRSGLLEDVQDRRARKAIEGGICHRAALRHETGRRHRRRAW